VGKQPELGLRKAATLTTSNCVGISMRSGFVGIARCPDVKRIGSETCEGVDAYHVATRLGGDTDEGHLIAGRPARIARVEKTDRGISVLIISH
jgi:hypothetical protein